MRTNEAGDDAGLVSVPIARSAPRDAGVARSAYLFFLLFLRVAFLRVAFLRVAFLRVAFLRVAFLRVAFLRVAFFRVAFFFRAAILG